MNRFDNKVAVITGGARGIGRRIAERFLAEGARVEIIDKEPCHLAPEDDSTDIGWFEGDVAQPDVLERFARDVIGRRGHVDYLINNALPLMKGIDECTWDDFLYAQKVGVAAPFYLTKLFMPHFPAGSAIVNISSTRHAMSQPHTESYTAAKGGVTALTHALAASLGPHVRVNSISPGWINTTTLSYSGSDAAQHPAGRVGVPDDIASMVLFLCSAEAGFITGENITIDGGMTRLMIYHNDCGWKLL